MTRHTIDRPAADTRHDERPPPGRISRLEYATAGLTALVLTGLVVAEPDILEAPFENARTMGFTVGGTLLAAVALTVMLRLRVLAPVRIVVLGAPFVAVSWWLISPYFIDDVVNDEFETSIVEATDQPQPSASTPTTAPPTTGPQPPADAGASNSGAEPPPSADAGAPTTVPEAPTAPAPPPGPVLLGAGQFVGLAGHEGTGDAGFFRLDSGEHVLRLERFDIQNGPDLRLYVVPGADQTSPGDASLYLGELRGNVGDQTYNLPTDFTLIPGDWTVLVWCEAFSVEFVGATISIT